MVFIFLDCKKNENNGLTGSISSIKGKFENWKFGSDMTIKFVGAKLFNSPEITYGFSIIDNSGDFNISSLLNVEDKYLSPLDSAFPKGVIISNHSAKTLIGYIAFQIYSPQSEIPKYLALEKNKVDSNLEIKPGDFGIQRIYVNKDVSITGNATDQNFSKSKMSFDLHLKSGWNEFMVKYPTLGQEDVTTNLGSVNAKWFYQPL
jgi:hypothetical protein